MPAKQRHTEADIAALAEEFRKSWQEGQVLRSWLRVHAEELRHLVRHQDWAWANIGNAMSLAGITYRTGTHWTGEYLRRTLVKACATQTKRFPQVAVPKHKAKHTNQEIIPIQTDPEFRIIRRKAEGAPQAPAPARASARADLSDEEISAIAAGLPLKR